MNIQLNNKNAIVCGSTRGIGKAVALKLAEFGASIILIARNESKLKEVQNELPAREGQLHSSICVDFNEP
ncbi:MAG: SDR family NAD(P)-dependent oxidoreductase, partial [Calditrichae bacterium]|nr:SDR family NAD(P)-dependent oxidoreductase [Calditrichia bacterium]